MASLVGPAILMLGLVLHPFIPDLTDNAAVVEALDANHSRWFIAHFFVALGSAGLLLSFLVVRSHLRQAVGHEKWTARAIAPLAVGSVLFAMLPAMEIGMLAVADVGGDLLETQDALDTWFVPILLGGSFIYAIGTGLFVTGIIKADVFHIGQARAIAALLAVGALSRFVPMAPSLLAGGAALVLGFYFLASTIWRSAAAEQSRSSSSTRT